MSNFFVAPEKLTIRDTVIEVSPLAVKNISKAVKESAPIMVAITSNSFSPMDVADNADNVIALVALASNQTEEFIGDCNIAELTALLSLVIKVNSSFFIQVALPQIQTMMKEVATIAQTAKEQTIKEQTASKDGKKT